MFHVMMITLADILLACMTIALPEPHVSMIDNSNVRDVGVVYNKANFKGEAKFILEFKHKPQCLESNDNVMSIKICKDVECLFYTGANCDVGQDDFAVAFGCGDVPKVKTPTGNYFNHYRCGKPGSMGKVNHTVPTMPHKVGADEGAAMGI